MNHRFDPEYDIDITGLDHAEVLAALYNGAAPQGMGFIAASPRAMTVQAARKLLEQQNSFDYIQGRPIKVALRDNVLIGFQLYDRDAGRGAAHVIVAALRTQTPDPSVTESAHISVRGGAQ